MSNFLQTLIYGAQPAPAPVGRRTFTRAQNRKAKAAGFPSAEAAVLWQEQQRRGAVSEAPAIKRHSLGNGLKAAGMIHPANILGYVLGKIDSATK